MQKSSTFFAIFAEIGFSNWKVFQIGSDLREHITKFYSQIKSYVSKIYITWPFNLAAVNPI
jgi:hypothetical protein